MPRFSRQSAGWFYVAPATLYLLAFAIAPMIACGWYALHRWPLIKPGHEFIGFDNFSNILSGVEFRGAIWNTLRFVLYGVPASVALALAVALLVAPPLRGMGFFRTLFYVPAVCSQVALSMLWSWIFLPGVGLINTILGWLGFDSGNNFLASPTWAMFALVTLFMWLGLGPRMIIFVAGLHAIPTTLYEAASLDGCGGWARFRHVTLPMLLPTTLFIVVTTTIAAFQIFTPVYMLTQGGPQHTTDVVLYHIYNEAWQKFELGSASAMSYILLAMILAVSLVQLRLMRDGLRGETVQ